MRTGSWGAGLLTAVLLAAVLSLESCTLDNVAADYSPASHGNNGVVVMTLGRTGAAEFDMTALLKRAGGSTYTVVVDNNLVKKDFGKVVNPPPGSPYSDWGYVPADAPLERVVVVSLPAGDYDFQAVTGKAPRFSGSAPDGFSIRSDAPGLSFKVSPGQVTYLGTVVFGFPGWLALSQYNGPMQIMTADTRERDASIVKERYPNLGSNLPDRMLAGAVQSKTVRYYLYRDAMGDGSGKGM
jgi:hypothetical protein